MVRVPGVPVTNCHVALDVPIVPACPHWPGTSFMLGSSFFICVEFSCISASEYSATERRWHDCLSKVTAITQTRDESILCPNYWGEPRKPLDLSLSHDQLIMETMESDPPVTPAQWHSRDWSWRVLGYWTCELQSHFCCLALGNAQHEAECYVYQEFIFKSLPQLLFWTLAS